MRLKKTNAVIALITLLIFLVHSLYQTVSYVFLIRVPVIPHILGGTLTLFFVAHAVISVIIIFKRNDTVKIEYFGQNRKTALQRDLGILSFILFWFHPETAGHLPNIVLTVIQVIFFCIVFVHIAVSFSKAFVTLGVIQDMNKLKTVDRVTAIVCTLLCILMNCVVVTSQCGLFAGV